MKKENIFIFIRYKVSKIPIYPKFTSIFSQGVKIGNENDGIQISLITTLLEQAKKTNFKF